MAAVNSKSKRCPYLLKSRSLHTLGLILIFTLLIWIVYYARLGDSSLAEFTAVSLQQLRLGPQVSLFALLPKPTKAFGLLDQRFAWGMTAVFLLAFAALISVGFDRFNSLSGGAPNGSGSWKTGRLNLIKLAILGLAMLILAYPLTFTVPAAELIGRGSRVHFSAVVGLALFVSCLIALLFYAIKVKTLRIAFVIVLAAFFSLLGVYKISVQDDYVQGWMEQKVVWAQILALAGDARNGSVILIEDRTPSNPKQIIGLSWSMARMMENIYDFPKEWEKAPRVYMLRADWKSDIGTAAGHWQLNEQTVISYPAEYQTVDSRSVIFLEMSAGALRRRSEPLVLDGEIYALQEKGKAVLPLLQKRILYDLLIEDD